MFRLNSDSQTNELVGSKLGDDRLQTVVTTSRTAFADPNLPERQGEVV